jgi:hypothetical protein
VFRNTNMNWGNGTKTSITPNQQRDVFEYCLYADDVSQKQRTDLANALGEINSKNRGIK